MYGNSYIRHSDAATPYFEHSENSGQRTACQRLVIQTYSAVTGMTGLPKLVCGSQRIPGEQRQVGPCWTILKKKSRKRCDIKERQCK